MIQGLMKEKTHSEFTLFTKRVKKVNEQSMHCFNINTTTQHLNYDKIEVKLTILLCKDNIESKL